MKNLLIGFALMLILTGCGVCTDNATQEIKDKVLSERMEYEDTDLMVRILGAERHWCQEECSMKYRELDFSYEEYRLCGFKCRNNTTK